MNIDNKIFERKFAWYGAYTLAKREIYRFLKVYHQTIIAPAISSMIFLTIFMISLGGTNKKISGMDFIDFIGYGLIIMTVIQNAFANSSSSIILSKIVGYINDLLMVPLSGSEIAIAYTAGSLARGILAGLLVSICLIPFVNYEIYSLSLVIYYAISAAVFMGLLGLWSGIAASSFDQISAITNYVVMPFSFLSGTFYSVDQLPAILKKVNLINPFFYLIDGFRYGMTGYGNLKNHFGFYYILFLNIFLFIIISITINKGWKIRT